MSGAAQVDPAAIAQVAQSLARYGAAEESVFNQVEGAIRAATGRAQQEQSRRRQELAHAQAALQACRRQEDADCSVLEHAVQKAETRLDAANQAMRVINAAAGRYQPAKARHAATVQGLLLGARTHLGRKSQEIQSYLAAGGGGGAGGSGGGHGPGSAGGGSQVPDAALKIAKAVVWDLGPVAATNILGLSTGKDALFDAIGDVIGPALEAVREPGAFRAGMAMTGDAGYKALGNALQFARGRLHG